MQDFLNFLNNGLTFDVNAFLVQAGQSPFQAMAYLFVHGGWLLFIIAFFWAGAEGWLFWRRMLSARQKEWVVLALDIPKFSEKDPGQSLKAVENMFAHFAGAHSPITWTDKWIKGKFQDPISCEIISIEGHVQFVIRSLRILRDLIEASIYAQYPNADIVEIEDYVKSVPQFYPDKEWDLAGTEMITVRKEPYPFKTYPEFEHSMTGEFKDPLAVLLEGLSRLGTGEQAWVQFLVLPMGQKEWNAKMTELIKKLKGDKTPAKATLAEEILFAPFNLFIAIANEFIGSASAAPAKPESPLSARMFNLSPGERKALEAVEIKAGKVGSMGKVRFVYVAKKNVFKKPRIYQSFIGFMKQMNANDMQSLKPDTDVVGMNGGLWFFRDRRNNFRKNKLIENYRNRATWEGMPPYYVGTEELATWWHFPHTFQVKAPQLKKQEIKYTEPPQNIPFA
jgi:hypothetical protein